MNWKHLFEGLIEAGDVVLDIGAHQGEMTEFCAAIVGPAGRVIAFEPQPDHFGILSRKKIKNVVCEQKAVSNIVGALELYYGTDPRAEMASTTVQNLANRERLGRRIKRVSVSAVTVDEYCEAHQLEPTLIKIDVEGAEDLVLEGALRTLRTCRPAVYFEQGVPCERIPATVRLLRECGYEVAISDFVKFTDTGNSSQEEGRFGTSDCEKSGWTPPTRWWQEGRFLTSACEALANKLIRFDDAELMRQRPLLTNMIAIHAGGGGTPWRQFDVIDLNAAVKLLVPPILPRKDAIYQLKLFLRTVLPRPVHASLRRLLGRR